MPKKKKINSFLLTFDQEKAFDKVDRDFLYRILKKMNFNGKFINVIKTLYTENKSNGNGFLSSVAFSRARAFNDVKVKVVETPRQGYCQGRNFGGKKIWRFLRFLPKTAKLSSRQI